jgi:hypothetical protein
MGEILRWEGSSAHLFSRAFVAKPRTCVIDRADAAQRGAVSGKAPVAAGDSFGILLRPPMVFERQCVRQLQKLDSSVAMDHTHGKVFVDRFEKVKLIRGILLLLLCRN